MRPRLGRRPEVLAVVVDPVAQGRRPELRHPGAVDHIQSPLTDPRDHQRPPVGAVVRMAAP
jgi:hypothetical protein